MIMATELVTTATDDRIVEYVPFGESKPIKLTLAIVRTHIAVPTRSGQMPSDSDLIRFMMLCRAGELNPWTRDAYLVGYDTQDGPKFSLITAIQALLKRAEANPHFDGLESGVVVMGVDGTVTERQGNLVFPGETLYGGWARVWRKDRSRVFYDALALKTYNTGKSQWAKDPAGMIDKCAQASVLRAAFPTQLGSLYIEQERGLIERGESRAVAATTERSGPPRTIADLTARIAGPTSTAPAATDDANDPQQSALDSLLASIGAAGDRVAVESLYDSAVGPDSRHDWSPDELAEIERAREQRLTTMPVAVDAPKRKGGKREQATIADTAQSAEEAGF